MLTVLIHAQASDLERINQILNHPEVFPLVSWGSDEPFAFHEDSLNGLFFLMPEDRNGVFIVDPLDIENAEVHSAFLPGHRGKNAVDTAWEGMEWVFTATSISTLWTKVPEGNCRADAMCRVMGWEPMGGCGAFDLWRMDILRWTAKAPGLEAHGEAFHEALEPEQVTHGKMAFHDRAVGAAALMVKNLQERKAIDLYNTLAYPTGWDFAVVESLDPLRVRVGNNMILLRDEKGSIRVENAPCQPVP